MRRLLLVMSAVAIAAPWAVAQDDRGDDDISVVTPLSPDEEPDSEPAAPGEPVTPDVPVAPDLGSIEDPAEAGNVRDPRTMKQGYTEDHPWVDAPVFGGGERIGEIDRVHFFRGVVDTIVIDIQGEDGAGGAVEVTVEDVESVTRPNGAEAFELELAMADFRSLPGYSGVAASDDEPSTDDVESGDDAEASAGDG